MSYILDALRRAATERERGSTPATLATPTTTTTTTTPATWTPTHADAISTAAQQDGAVHQAKRWFYMAVGIALILITALAWLLFSRYAKDKPVTQVHQVSALKVALVPADIGQVAINTIAKPVLASVEDTATSAVAAPPSTPVLAGLPVTSPVLLSPVPALLPELTRHLAEEDHAPIPAVAPRPPAIAGKVPAPTTAPLLPKAAALTEIISPRHSDKVLPPASSLDPRIFTASELPDNIRASLPKLILSGASFSDNPAHRMLIANGQIYRETEDVAPGLQIARINAKDVIFKFQGYQYSQSYP